MLSRTFRRALPARREVTHGGVYYEVRDAARERTLRLNEVQYIVALHLDGREPDAVRKALHERYGLALATNHLAALIEELDHLGLMQDVATDDGDEFDAERTVAADACTLQALALLPRLPAGAPHLLREPVTQVIEMEAELPPTLVNRLRAETPPAVALLRGAQR
jgi:hypothetical protein